MGIPTQLTRRIARALRLAGGPALACVLAFAALPGPTAASEGAPAWQGPARCRFMAPADWAQADVRWSGACVARKAEGRGVLRAYLQGRVVRSFYGRLLAGRPALGADEVEAGFRAGRFDASGQAVTDGERNTLIQAFDEAAAAARQLAATYRRGGNAASARFYADKARQLAQQMD